MLEDTLVPLDGLGHRGREIVVERHSFDDSDYFRPSMSLIGQFYVYAFHARYLPARRRGNALKNNVESDILREKEKKECSTVVACRRCIVVAVVLCGPPYIFLRLMIYISSAKISLL